MSGDYTAVRIEKIRSPERVLCGTGGHPNHARPWAVFYLYKPASMPDLPGPDRNPLCRGCLAIFLEKTALPIELFEV